MNYWLPTVAAILMFSAASPVSAERFTCPRPITVADRWVVGYGLDSDGLYRNLPYISFVEET